jgi:hypothetical protein
VVLPELAQSALVRGGESQKRGRWGEGKQAPFAALEVQARPATAEGPLGWVGPVESQKLPW